MLGYFCILNLMSRNIDAASCKGVDENMRRYGYGRTMVASVPIERDFCLVGFSITGYDFLVCARCFTDHELKQKTLGVLEKLENIRQLHQVKKKISMSDLLVCGVGDQHFELDLGSDQIIYKTLQIAVRKCWA